MPAVTRAVSATMKTLKTLAGPADPATGLAPGAVLKSQSSQTYQLERRLGAGAFGTVWLCREGGRGERRAVKVLPADRAVELAVEVAQARRACDAAGEYHVPKLYEASQADVSGGRGPKLLLIAMEFVDGATASNVARAAALPPRCTQTILGDVAAALGRLHDFGLVHRDVKGDNVLVSYTGCSYLCDFGVSAHEDELRSRGELGPVGTPDFMAPEIMGRPPHFSDKVDVWALGILAIELATGSTPMRALRLPDTESVMEYVAMTGPPAVPQLPNYSSSFRRTVESCLQREPSRRTSVRQLLDGEDITPQGSAGYELVRALLQGHAGAR